MNLAGEQFISRDAGSENTSFISSYEGGFVLKELTTPLEEVQAYHLRHKIFCQELKWVPENKRALEIDEYDSDAIFLGVFNPQNKLVGFLRLLLSRGYFMIEREFASLVGNEHKIRKENDTAEGSRLCVAPEARECTLDGNFGVYRVSMLIYKALYLWCVKNNVHYVYSVVEYKVFRSLRPILRCELVGKPTTMPDGAIAVANIIDWRRFETINKVKRPEMLRWFIQYQSSPIPWPQPQPEPFLQHQDVA